MSIQTLVEKIKEKGNPTVAGLDARLEYIPQHISGRNMMLHGETLRAAAESVVAFNCGLIDALCDIVPAVKPQAAYYELLGSYGAMALKETIDYAHAKGMYVIGDIKRNDIGATATAYAEAYLGKTRVGDTEIAPYGCDSVTVNGYLGTDGVEPFLKECRSREKSLFMLVKTSNPSSGELQDQKMESGKTVYETMGEFCEHWGETVMGKYGYSGVGAVVGATYPAQLGEMREKAPHTFFLVPHRVAARMTLPRRLTRTVSAPLSIPPAALCAHGRRKSATSMTMHRRQDAKPFACATRSAHASAKFARTDE